jgi:hypothetical protein
VLLCRVSKLHDLLLMHFAVRQKSVNAIGQQQTPRSSSTSSSG